MRLTLCVVALTVTLCAQAGTVRVLLAGNSVYRKLPATEWAAADAKIVEQAFGGLGNLAITPLYNAPTETLRQALEEQFIPSIQPGDVVVFFFSGQAVQADQQNYLLGVDFDPAADLPLRDRAYLVDRLRTYFEARKPEAVLIVVDGGYAEPALEGLADYAPGLAASRPVANGIVVYSTTQDQSDPMPSAAAPTAFAAELGELIRTPGLSLIEFAPRLSASVAERTQGRARPYQQAVYAGKFHFIEAPVTEPPKPIVQIVREGPERRQHRDDREYYIKVPAGTFMMGCVPGSECEPAEKPQHETTISSPFWLGENEVQVASYKRFVDITRVVKMPKAPAGFDWRDQSLPIVMIPWEDAQKYCAWLGGRLPTEAEWEYAARAGSTNQTYPMADFSRARDVANFRGKSGNDTYDWVAPVGKFDKNAFGFHDLSGNVWEWVADVFGPYTGAAQQDPAGPAPGKEHVIRGGSFDSDPARHLRLSFRDKASGAQNKIGFRCMLPDTDQVKAQLQ